MLRKSTCLAPALSKVLIGGNNNMGVLLCFPVRTAGHYHSELYSDALWKDFC